MYKRQKLTLTPDVAFSNYAQRKCELPILTNSSDKVNLYSYLSATCYQLFLARIISTYTFCLSHILLIESIGFLQSCSLYRVQYRSDWKLSHLSHLTIRIRDLIRYVLSNRFSFVFHYYNLLSIQVVHDYQEILKNAKPNGASRHQTELRTILKCNDLKVH